MSRAACYASMLLAAFSAQAASRAQFGGTLRLAVSHPLEESDPLLADTPWEAAVHSLVSRSICILSADGKAIHELSESISSPSPTALAVKIRPGIRWDGGGALTAEQVAQSWLRTYSQESASPYRSLLYPLKDDKRPAISAANSTEVRLSLEFAWPDLASSLCHPALAVADGDGAGIGPFVASKSAGILLSNIGYPGGAPFLDRLIYVSNSERAIARKIRLGQVDAALTHLGTGSTPGGLFTTYLAFDERKTGSDFRRAFAAAVDSADLARNFAHSPAEPNTSLLPKAIAPEQPPNPGGARAPRAAAELTLLYDVGLEDQRRVAERIQVKMHDLGYRIALRPLGRKMLRQRWARRDFDLAIFSLLLPPRPAAALAVVLDLAHQPELMRAELPPLGQLTEVAARDARARERAAQLTAQVPLIPLYSQRMRVYAKPNLQGLKYDAYGLPLLDEAFLRSP